MTDVPATLPKRATPLTLWLVGIGIVIFYFCFHDGAGGLGLFVFTTFLVGAIGLAYRPSSTQVILLSLTLVVAAVWLIRDSATLGLGTFCFVCLLLLWVVTRAKTKRLLDVQMGDLFTAVSDLVLAAVTTPAWLIRGCTQRATGRTNVAAWLRIGFLVLPVLFLVALLLASSGNWLYRLSTWNTAATLATLGAGLLVSTLAIRGATAQPGPTAVVPGWSAGRLEGKLMLGGLVVLLGIFLAVQVVDSQGATPAGYDYAAEARAGYVQLFAVAAIVATTILIYDRALPRDNPSEVITYNTLSVTLVLLTWGLLVTAAGRLLSYAAEYGWTMARLLGVLFGLWLGIVLLLLLARALGFRRDQTWLGPTSVLAAVVLWCGFALANPEAIIVRNNLGPARPQADAVYLGGLSADAVPALVNHEDVLTPWQKRQLRKRFCVRSEPTTGILKQNFSRLTAARTLNTWCS